MVHRPDPSTSDRATALARQGAVAAAYELLNQAIASGDAVAAATLADWRIAGDPVRRDIGEARRLYGLAADLGLSEAEPVFIALLANGAGGSGRQWGAALGRLQGLARRDGLARRQRDLLAAMALDADGNPAAMLAGETLCSAPAINHFSAFLSPAECRYLIDRALPLLQPAVVINPATGQAMRDPVRVARCVSFPFVHEDPVIHAINRRIAAATGTTYEQGEPLQILCYEPGEEYKLHSDALPPGHNQRTQTFLVWLTTDFEGGETDFPRVPLRFRGAAGDGLRFANLRGDGTPDPLAWHAGLPVTRGRKLLLSKWIRERPLDLAGPPGRPF